MTNYTVYTDTTIKSVEMKQPELYKSTDQKNELNKQDLTKGIKALEEISEIIVSRREQDR